MKASYIVMLEKGHLNLNAGTLGVVLNSQDGLTAVFETGVIIHCQLPVDVLKVVGIAPHFDKKPDDYGFLWADVAKNGIGKIVDAVAYRLGEGGVSWFKDGDEPGKGSATALALYESLTEKVEDSKHPDDEVGLFYYGVESGTDENALGNIIDEQINWHYSINQFSYMHSQSPNYIENNFHFYEQPSNDTNLVEVVISGAGNIHRAVYPNAISDGELFNVYHGRKGGVSSVAWKGTLALSLVHSEQYRDSQHSPIYVAMYLERPFDGDALSGISPEDMVSHQSEASALKEVFDYVSDRIPHVMPEAYIEYVIGSGMLQEEDDPRLMGLDDEAASRALLDRFGGYYMKHIVDHYFSEQSRKENTEAWYVIKKL